MDILAEIVTRRPGEWSEKITPWVLLVMGGAIVLLMVYSCAWAPDL